MRPDQIIPVVVLSEKEIGSGPEELGRILQYLVDYDDVCTDEFTGIIVVKPSASAPEPGESLDRRVSVSNPSQFSSVYHLVPNPSTFEAESQLPSGPYFLSGRNLHQAWRLYPDELDAFTFGLIPDDPFNASRYWSSTLSRTLLTAEF